MGGNAFKEQTRRVTRQEVFETVSWLQRHWSGSSLDQTPLVNRLLGSAGKRGTSGDIDLNIDESVYDFDIVRRELVFLLGDSNVIARPGNNQIFTAVPICGNSMNGKVQVDFMFGNKRWQYFSYESAYGIDAVGPRVFEKSKYKGLFRTELIKALVAFNSDWILEENGEVVARVGPTFFHDRGVVWRYRHRPFKKDGSGQRVKALKEVTEKEFKELYPTSLSASHTQITDPKKVVSLIFDRTYTVNHCISYEMVWNSAKHCYSSKHLDVISKMYLERLNSLKVDIPQDILDEHTKATRRKGSKYRPNRI